MNKGMYFFILILILFLSFCSLPDEQTKKPPKSPPVDEYELICDKILAKDTTDKKEIWFSINAGIDMDYEISWSEADNNAAYTGDIIISVYEQNKTTPYNTDIDTGTITIHTNDCSQIFIKVTSNGNDGTFAIKYNITNIATPDTWTIMWYLNGWVNDVIGVEILEQIINNYDADTGVNIIIIMDRETAPYQTDLFDPEFSDTRLFMATADGIVRIGGGNEFPGITNTSTYEANMGDADTVKKFINFCKANFPAENYALFFHAHGESSKSFSFDGDGFDYEDALHPGELSSVLGSEHSVDIIGLDSCMMGNIETAYQFRNDISNTGFSAEYYIGSPTALWTPPAWNYASIIQRISRNGGNTEETDSFNGGKEQIYNPAAMSPLELSVMILEEFQDKNNTINTISCYDQSKIAALKEKADELAVSLYANIDERTLIEAIRDDTNRCRPYYDYVGKDADWIALHRMLIPYFEFYDLCDEIEDGNNFSINTKNLATQVKNLIDDVILYSYYNGSNAKGMSIFFSPGDEIYDNKSIFKYHWWYNALDVSARGALTDEKYTGLMDWCINKATDVIGQVDNWFELLDAWYDGGGNDAAGGWNGYQY